MKSSDEARTIFITDFDLGRLENLLGKIDMTKSRDTSHLEDLEFELGRAEIVDPKKIPPDVITMNSRVRLLDIDSEEEKVYTLVFPHDADPKENKISILAPIGTALLGYRVGDIITWQVPGGTRQFKVVEIIYQPEAAGDYHR
ncbi:MAG: nucleoside diphosphate kinase regulator [Deltaproteobacteria bacterium]|nr:nucleoside diphosphate kinase regulator [Deltaproteobacteria bacterium]